MFAKFIIVRVSLISRQVTNIFGRKHEYVRVGKDQHQHTVQNNEVCLVRDKIPVPTLGKLYYAIYRPRKYADRARKQSVHQHLPASCPPIFRSPQVLDDVLDEQQYKYGHRHCLKRNTSDHCVCSWGGAFAIVVRNGRQSASDRLNHQRDDALEILLPLSSAMDAIVPQID
jgi:hypothetical protein